MDSIPILSLDNIGIRVCLREGMRVKSCNGVNYWKDGLQCTLLSVSVSDNLIESPGHVYTDLDSWTMDSDSCSPNPCPDGTKCALSRSNGYVCLLYDPVPNPCEPNPCNNGGICTEITADTFSCDCDSAWTGDRCDDPVPNPCEPNPCNNAGSCTELTSDSFSCDCDPVWRGDRCDVICRDGVWPGYYVHNGVQYPWSMSIQFDANSISGGGSDSVGTFTIDGSWDPLSKDINFVKAYTSHTVSYTGQVTADVCTMYGLYQVGSTTGAFNMTICT
ncbi:protein jagged-1-like [Mytilus trossulus]|uniref:protein jagged-1-like n=1 Tax=Mytilus trossulus TaxID=6551 RepID=UPI003003E129